MMEYDKFKFYLVCHNDKRLTEVSEELFKSVRFRSDMTSFEVAFALNPGDELYCNLWIQDKLHHAKDFDELVELLVRNLHLNISCAKDLSQKITGMTNSTKIHLGSI